MDQDQRALPRGGMLLLLALTGLLLAFRLGAVPLLGPDEPRYARVAVEMSRSGDLVTPTLQGQPWMEKPILYYWLAAAAFKVFGENEWAARLPSVAAMLLLVATTAILGARLYGGTAGLHAGFIAATGLLTFAYGRAASMDMLLAATLSAGLALLVLRQRDQAPPIAAVAGGAFLGLATLAKGPIGLLLPLLILIAHALVNRRTEPSPPILTAGSVVAFVVVAAPWYALIFRAQGRAFIDTFFINHNLERFTSTVHHHPGSVLYYVPVLLGGLFPWSSLLLPAFGRLDRRLSADRLLLLWVLVPLAFFSIAGSKLPGYILPVVPPLAILMGRGAVALIDREVLPAGLGPTGVAVLSLLLGCAALGGASFMTWKGEPGAPLLLPAGVWATLLAWMVLRVIQRSPAEAVRSLRVGAAGFLLLLALAAPTVVALRESGRALFLPAGGHPVFAWGAWRTAWMAGYFYNDGRVREVSGPTEPIEAAKAAPTLVLTGPDERLLLESTPRLSVRLLAQGPRRTSLLEIAAARNAN